MQSPTQRFERAGQFAQALQNEFVVLARRIRLRPQAGLDHIQAQQRAGRGGIHQSRMVMQPQVAFEPDHAVSHGLLRRLGGFTQKNRQTPGTGRPQR
jgi:hypothetical protein